MFFLGFLFLGICDFSGICDFAILLGFAFLRFFWDLRFYCFCDIEDTAYLRLLCHETRSTFWHATIGLFSKNYAKKKN